MNYLSFCSAMSAALLNHLKPEASISRESIRKNNGVCLDALVIHLPESVSSPILYLKPLYQRYQHGISIETICNMILSALESDSVISQDMIDSFQNAESARSLIAYRLISRKNNEAFLKTVPWIPFLDLAVIFYLYLGEPNETLITSVIHNRMAEFWNFSTDELFSIARENTRRFFPDILLPLDQMLYGYLSEEEEEALLCPLSDIYVLTNQSGIHGATCLLYEDILKDLADRHGTDLIILPSSIHEVLVYPDYHERNYEELCRMIRSINQSDVAPEDILSDKIYLFRRASRPQLTIWNDGSHTADTAGTENP